MVCASTHHMRWMCHGSLAETGCATCSSFFFLMDTLGTLSLLVEIGWIGLSFSGTIARASRTSRVGTKLARMSKVLRLLRLARLFRVVKYAYNRRREEEVKSSGSAIAEELSENISKQVAALTLIAVMCAPLLSHEYSSEASVVFVDTYQTLSTSLTDPTYEVSGFTSITHAVL
eukprot:scaffold2075_cov444-Prasinococcus_capsulatus_cf.AAC.8